MLNTDSLRQDLVVSRFGFQPAFVHYPCWTHTWKYDVKAAKYRPTAPGNEPQSWTPGRPFAWQGSQGAIPGYTRRANKKFGTLPKHWIYVFAFSPERLQVDYFAEIFSDKKSRQLVNPANTKAFRLDWDPDMDLTHAFPELPAQSNGQGWFYTAIGVPYRLSNACVEELEKQVLSLVDWEDSSKAKPETSTDDRGRTFALDAPIRFELPVLYPFNVLETSANNLLRARSLHAISLGSQMKVAHGRRGGKDYLAANRARNNLPQQTFIRGMLQFLDVPSLRKDLEGRLRPEGRQNMESDLADIEFDQQRHHVVAESYARDIAGWMLRGLFKLVLDGYHLPEGKLSSVEPRPILEPLELAAKALSTSAFGIEFLASFQGPIWEGTILGVVASPRHPFTKDHFDMAAKYGKGVLSIFSVVLAARTFTHNIDTKVAVSQLRKSIQDLAPGWEGSIKVRNDLIKTHLPKSKGGKFAPAEVMLRKLRIDQDGLDKIAKGIGHAEVALEALEAINLALAVAEYSEKFGAGPTGELKATADIAFAAGDFLATVVVRVAPEAAKRVTAVFGIVSALYTGKGDLDDMFERWASGDEDAAAAKAAMVVGAAGSIITAAGALTGVAVLGPIGAVAVVIGVVGATIYEFVKDTKLELLVLFCRYGKRAGTKGDHAQPGWTNTPLGVLGHSWERQLEALSAIQGYFDLQIETHEKRRLKDGHVIDVNHARLRATSLDSWTEFIIQWEVGEQTEEETLTGAQVQERLRSGTIPGGEEEKAGGTTPFLLLEVPASLVEGSLNSVIVRVVRLAKAHGVRSVVFGKSRQGLALPLGGPLSLPVGGSQITVPSSRKSL